MKNIILMIIFITVCIHHSIEVTTIHHDKPERASIQIMASSMTNSFRKDVNNITLTQSERHKRLLPYYNFYQSQPNNQVSYEKPSKTIYNEYESKRKFNPFTESNLSPGPFKPIISQFIPQKIKTPTIPNFSEIYDKLSQLKLAQNTRPTYIQNPQQSFLFKPQIYNKQPSKTYTPKNVDIPSEQEYQYVNHQIAIDVPQSNIHIQDNYNRYPYQENKKPFIIVSANTQEQTNKPIYVVQQKPEYQSPPKYETITTDLNPNYEPFPKYYQNLDYSNTKNSINLSAILKHLQAINALPKTLTSDNIDNSIKTLIKILNSLKKQQKLPKPIIVKNDPVEEIENEADLYPNYMNDVYPEDTEEGGTPGKAGVDYPALSTIPRTTFNCKTQRYKGFFGDPDTNCQVWHYCDLNGGQASFLCPNGTIFSQVALTCDWWYNVKCASTPQLYVLNERLYKYIIPLSPKFPEDYTGPLVDKYLALKFQEMEEKMKKEKKGKEYMTKLEKGKQQENESEDIDKIVNTSTNASIRKETLETVENDNQNK